MEARLGGIGWHGEAQVSRGTAAWEVRTRLLLLSMEIGGKLSRWFHFEIKGSYVFTIFIKQGG